MPWGGRYKYHYLLFNIIIMQTILEKGQTIELKKDGVAPANIRVGLSWDVSEGKSMDLDLFVVRHSDKKAAYYGEKNALKGVKLSDDNLTGEGDGDDEFAIFNAVESEDTDYSVCVNIYGANAKGQKFADVKNAKATVYNADTNEVLATYSITENGGDHTALIVGQLTDRWDFYDFTAKGTFINGSIAEVVASL